MWGGLPPGACCLPMQLQTHTARRAGPAATETWRVANMRPGVVNTYRIAGASEEPPSQGAGPIRPRGHPVAPMPALPTVPGLDAAG